MFMTIPEGREDAAEALINMLLTDLPDYADQAMRACVNNGGTASITANVGGNRVVIDLRSEEAMLGDDAVVEFDRYEMPDDEVSNITVTLNNP